MCPPETRVCHPPGEGEGARACQLLTKVRVDRACCLHGEDGSHLVQGGDQDPNLADAGCEQQGPCRLPIGFAMAEDLGAGWGKGNIRALHCQCHATLHKGPRHSSVPALGAGTGTQGLCKWHCELAHVLSQVSPGWRDSPPLQHSPTPGRSHSPSCIQNHLCLPGTPPRDKPQLSLATASVESGTPCSGQTRCPWRTGPSAAGGTWRVDRCKGRGRGCMSGCIRGHRQHERVRAGAGRAKEGR